MSQHLRDKLFIGIGGYAVAIDPSTGAELWRTKLKLSSYVTIHQSGTRIFAGANGELFCLDAATGSILWNSKLKGLGMGLLSFASTGEGALIAALEDQRDSNA